MYNDLCQQNRIVRNDILSLLVDMSHSEWFEHGRQKFSHKKFFLPGKALLNGNCGAGNTCIYYIIVLFYSTGQNSSLDAVFYSIGLRSLYSDREK